jgi:hypothetical protein
MICELVVKCVTLIALIHGLRILGRRVGPRASGLILGLPSSTAIVLVLCGRERGPAGAIEIAEASLLGLIAAVSLPLAYAQTVRQGWGLPASLTAAVAAYAVVASGLGYLRPGESSHQLAISCGSLLLASCVASRIGLPAAVAPHTAPSDRWAAIARTVIPVIYVTIVGIVSTTAGPRWTGLVSTFPSVSTVALAVTHLEEGAVSASRIARALPRANLSTAAFLAAFCFACPVCGLGWGMLCGYSAALINLVAIELIPRSLDLRFPLSLPDWQRQRATWHRIGVSRFLRYGSRSHFWSAAHHRARIRPPHRKHFSPHLEILPC